MLSIFSFESQEIRFVNDMPVAIDVAKILGYASPKDAVKDLISPKNLIDGAIPTIRYGENKERMQKVKLISKEAGIYQLIFKSHLPKAEQFQTWVFEEVLPSIRKTGSYTVEQQLTKRDAIDYTEAVKITHSFPDSILKNLLLEEITDELALKRNLKYLNADEKPKQWTIVKVRARELGYSGADIGNGSGLGKFVKSRINPVHSEYIGKYPVYHYEINNELDGAIHAYFEKKLQLKAS